MKYFAVFIVLVLLWFSSNQVVDLSEYQKQTKTIEVKGEVESPGIYEVGYHDLIEDILKEAGGVLESADLRSINLSQDLSNNSVLVIPERKEFCISISSASLEELTTLTSIGPATAQRIIDYRTEYGFQSIEDIMKVKGIKEKSYEKIKERICL